MRESHDETKLLIPMNPGSTFCHSAPETDAPAAMIMGGEAMLAVNPLHYEMRYEISLSEKWRKHVNKCWVYVSSMRLSQSNYGYTD